MENANVQFGLVPFASVLALLFAWYFYAQLKRTSEGTPRMVYIAECRTQRSNVLSSATI